MKKKNEKITTLNEVVGIMKDAFQSNQEYMDKRFDMLTVEMRDGFRKVNTEINKINLNAVDVVRKEEFDKLETRVEDAEEALDLKLKKA